MGKITSGCKSRDHYILKPLPFLQAAAGRKLVLYPGPHVERDVGLGKRLGGSDCSVLKRTNCMSFHWGTSRLGNQWSLLSRWSHCKHMTYPITTVRQGELSLIPGEPVASSVNMEEPLQAHIHVHT